MGFSRFVLGSRLDYVVIVLIVPLTMSTSDKNVVLAANFDQKTQNRLGMCQHEVLRAASKLQSWGLLLQRQSNEGFTELEGLGLALSDLGSQLETVAHQLDSVHFQSR